MKASEVLRRYAAGERDFRRLNLQGQSFIGADILGADFSKADIRGVEFIATNLSGSKFCGARAGLQQRWGISLVIVSWLLSGLSTILSSALGYVVTVLFYNSGPIYPYVGTIEGLVLGVFYFVSSTQGLAKGLSTVAFAVALPVAVAVAFDVVGIKVFAVGLTGAFAGSIACAVAGVVATASTFAGVVAAAGVVTGIITVGTGVVTGTIVITAGIVAVTGSFTKVHAAVTFVTSVVALTSTGWGASIGRQALMGNEKHAFIRTVAITFAAMGGTSFYAADLTDANFTSATLKSTDFGEAILTRTCWHQAEKLDYSCPGTTYLQNPHLRQLLISGQGQDQNFDRQDLRGVNLQNAYLQDASFIGADLSEANLQDADLSRAKLVQTQLDETNLTGAILTGATIEDWGITSHTKLDSVRCEYVFMRLETRDDPDRRRKPDNWAETFAEGEFGDFIKPIVDTLDLYHSQGVDPRAIAISFKHLSEDHLEAELEIVAMEKRGQENFLLRVSTALGIDRSELSTAYFEYYNRLKALPRDDLIFLLAQKDGQVQSLEIAFKTVTTGLTTVAEAPKYDQRGSNFGNFIDTAQSGSRQQSIQHNYASEQKQTLAEAAEEIQNLLKVLEKTNPAATQADKQAFVTAAIAPPTKERIVKALQAGGEKALEEFLKNPYVNVATAIIKEWQQAQ